MTVALATEYDVSAVHLICHTKWHLSRNGVPGLGLLCVPGGICSDQCVTIFSHSGCLLSTPPHLNAPPEHREKGVCSPSWSLHCLGTAEPNQDVETSLKMPWGWRWCSVVERCVSKFCFPSAHKRDNKMVHSVVVQLSTQFRTPGSDTGGRLRNEQIRTGRKGESVQVSCRKDRERV